MQKKQAAVVTCPKLVRRMRMLLRMVWLNCGFFGCVCSEEGVTEGEVYKWSWKIATACVCRMSLGVGTSKRELSFVV